MTGGHDWKQLGACLNGPHAWLCENCHEWTRSYNKPNGDAPLIDPDDGTLYEYAPTTCRNRKERTMNKPYPPIQPGTKVKVSKSVNQEGWMPQASLKKRLQDFGVVIGHHDSHGLCYDVRHSDGQVVCYDPAELEVVGDIVSCEVTELRASPKKPSVYIHFADTWSDTGTQERPGTELLQHYQAMKPWLEDVERLLRKGGVFHTSAEHPILIAQYLRRNKAIGNFMVVYHFVGDECRGRQMVLDTDDEGDFVEDWPGSMFTERLQYLR